MKDKTKKEIPTYVQTEVIDVSKTLIHNIFWFIMIGLAVLFSHIGLRKMEYIQDPWLNIMGTIAMMFFTLKFFAWAGYPQLYFKFRRKNEINKMICKHCNQEVKEPKTLIIDGVEYEIQTHDFNKTLLEIKIPKGWRLWKASDFEKFSLKDWDKLNLKYSWFFIDYPFAYNPNNYVARFGADSGRAVLGCDRDPSGRDAELGVRFAREVKK